MTTDLTVLLFLILCLFALRDIMRPIPKRKRGQAPRTKLRA